MNVVSVCVPFTYLAHGNPLHNVACDQRPEDMPQNGHGLVFG